MSRSTNDVEIEMSHYFEIRYFRTTTTQMNHRGSPRSRKRKASTTLTTNTFDCADSCVRSPWSQICLCAEIKQQIPTTNIRTMKPSSRAQSTATTGTAGSTATKKSTTPAEKLVALKMGPNEDPSYWFATINEVTGRPFNPVNIVDILLPKVVAEVREEIEVIREESRAEGYLEGIDDSAMQVDWANNRKKTHASKTTVASSTTATESPQVPDPTKNKRRAAVLYLDESDDCFKEEPFESDAKPPATPDVKVEPHASTPAPAPTPSSTTSSGSTTGSSSISSPPKPARVTLAPGVWETTQGNKYVIRLHDGSALVFNRYAPEGDNTGEMGYLKPKAKPAPNDLGPKLRITATLPPLGIAESAQADNARAFLTESIAVCEKRLHNKSVEHNCADRLALLEKKPALVVMTIHFVVLSRISHSRKVVNDVELRRRCLRALILIAFCQFDVSMDVWGHYYDMWSQVINSKIGSNTSYGRKRSVDFC